MHTPHVWKLWHSCVPSAPLGRPRIRPGPLLVARAECRPTVVFSVPLEDSTHPRPDCYHVYSLWCQDVEAELEDVMSYRLSMDAAATRKVIKYARNYEASIYKNPARVLSRVQSWMPLEVEYPGTDVRRLLALNPQLISYKASALRAKLEAVVEVLQLHDRSKLAQIITRCSALLTRSSESLERHVQSLRAILGADGANTAICRYPELISRDVSVLTSNFRQLAEVLDGNVHAAQRMVSSNPSLLKYTDTSDRMARLARTADIPMQDVCLFLLSLLQSRDIRKLLLCPLTAHASCCPYVYHCLHYSYASLSHAISPSSFHTDTFNTLRHFN